jgi:thermitase
VLDAWTYTRGAGVKVAVIDEKFDYEHEDLFDSIGEGSAIFEYKDEKTIEFSNDITKIEKGNHGTFCAGIIAAQRNNNVGVSGVAPESKLMLISCIYENVGRQSTLARAIQYAANPKSELGKTDIKGADIISCSIGSGKCETWILSGILRIILDDLPCYRENKGVPIFWSPENILNANISLNQIVSHQNVTAVVMSDFNDEPGKKSKGSTVSLSAPGVYIFSTMNDYYGEKYGHDSGNSYATPCAAGCAALALSCNNDLTSHNLVNILKMSADEIGKNLTYVNGHNEYTGFGRVNANEAVLLALSTVNKI